MLKRAVGLMIRDDDPMEPRAALRRAGGANEPDEADAAPELRAELEATKARIAQIEQEAEARRLEIEAEAERQRRALEAELNTAKAAAVAARGKARALAIDVQTAATDLQEAQEQVVEALRQLGKAEASIQRAKNLPGIRGHLMRWLARDVLE